jgi:hypothetical protein
MPGGNSMFAWMSSRITVRAEEKVSQFTSARSMSSARLSA